MSTRDEVFDAALALSEEQRAELASRLIRSLDDEPDPTPEEQAEINASWDAEISRRVREVEEGRAELIDGDQVMREMRQRFGI